MLRLASIAALAALLAIQALAVPIARPEAIPDAVSFQVISLA
jgi:hypothetical protein